jgi:hypothetical protein
MKTTIDIRAKQITLVAELHELAFLCSAINESLEAIEEWEFQTRTGYTRLEATELLKALTEAYQKLHI